MEKNINVEKLQGVIDVDKWLKSEQAGKDLCGDSDYCAYCDKSEENPCAHASLRASKLNDKPDDKPDEEGYVYVTRYKRSFTSRLIQNEKAQELYTYVKNALMSYKTMRSRTSFGGETFRSGGKLLAKITVRGKSVYVNFALNPADLADGKYKITDVSDKKSTAAVPAKLKLTSRRAAKYACELVKATAEQNGLALGKPHDKEYRFAFKTDDELIDKGLIKPYTVKVKAK